MLLRRKCFRMDITVARRVSWVRSTIVIFIVLSNWKFAKTKPFKIFTTCEIPKNQIVDPLYQMESIAYFTFCPIQILIIY